MSSLKKEINIVWLKRDLRSQDHEPLFYAENAGLPYLILYLFEPELIEYYDTSQRHLRFCWESIVNLNQTFNRIDRRIEVMYCNAIEAFQWLNENFNIREVFSYQESGVEITWDRDKKVKAFCDEHDIVWKEFEKDGLIRGINNRDGWDGNWYGTMNKSVIQNEYSSEKIVKLLDVIFPLPQELQASLTETQNNFQPGGETYGWKYLQSFMEGRGQSYHWQISKPESSRTSCSRISPYLAWGNLSVRQAYLYIKNHRDFKNHKRAYQGCLTRLKWRSHFVQKFEVECEYENRCINRGYELLKREHNPAKVYAWKSGLTGYPLVDACMRCLQETGWINFRMRAMVVSFLCHHLDQDWREGVYHLAQMFLDYEPGIHYPQFQMQAGTTGVNTVRMYNPIKQSLDHDPKGVFIRNWVPELRNVTEEHIHEPFKMTLIEQNLCSTIIGKDYPMPIIDLVESGKIAREKIWGHRSHPLVQKEQKRILKTHTRRSNASQ